MMLDMTRLTHNSYQDLLDLPFNIVKDQWNLLKQRLQEEKEDM